MLYHKVLWAFHEGVTLVEVQLNTLEYLLGTYQELSVPNYTPE